MPFRRNPYRSPAKSRGASLIEVLIAVLIMAIGLLGIAALQATTLKNSQSALQRSQAVVQTYAILDSMRANATVARAGGYNMGKVCATPAAAASLASQDINAWFLSMKGALGDFASTCGQVNCAANVCTVTVFWDDSRGSGDSATLQAHSIATTTQI
ncbi:type IV pilus modification protein PilV [Lysobacter psychrotolerans]|uniref:Type IV pilus modification protein PilV n=2 Tax=Montanilutibacter psychrotolerans TaxID=1327343 RepID=A0A3M8T5R1_9GAMM|nr:type IV pilus modification protein PilV [Lysobacter psychrotolerans]